MKKLLTIALLAAMLVSCATTETTPVATISKKPIRIEQINRPVCQLFALGGEIMVDYGHYISHATIPVLRKDDGSVFASEMDAINTMEEHGWNLKHVYSLTDVNYSSYSSFFAGLYTWAGSSGASFKLQETSIYLFENADLLKDGETLLRSELNLNEDQEEMRNELYYQYALVYKAQKGHDTDIIVYRDYEAVYNYLRENPTLETTLQFTKISERLKTIYTNGWDRYPLTKGLKKLTTPEEMFEFFKNYFL